MGNNKKKYIGIIVILAIILTSIISFKIFNKKDVELEPEILVSQSYEEVKAGDEAIDGTDYVTFDAFYLRDLDGDGYAEKLRGTCREIGTTDTLYMDLNVLTNGTLKDAKITINGKNFYFATALVKDSVISQDYIGTNTKEIVLNDVVNGTQKLIFGMIQSGDYINSSYIASAIGNDTNKYNVTDNTITLMGTHVSDEGVETEISKTVTLTNDWYGTTATTLGTTSQKYNIANALDEENDVVNVKFVVYPKEVDKELIISNQHVEIQVPEFFGYKPTKVTVDDTKAIVNYDSENSLLTIDLNAEVDENGVVTRSVSRSLSYSVTLTYPYEAYQAADVKEFALNIPIDATYSGYNNTRFENPYVSNVAQGIITVLYTEPEGTKASIDIRVGEYVEGRYLISKEKPLNIYNNIESENTEDLYKVRWGFSTGTELKDVPVVLREDDLNYTDKFLDVNANYIDMLEYIDNIGIYFSDPETLLGEYGYINVYNDETNELLHTFTKNDWSLYTSSNPYKYEIPIKHIRVETSNVITSSTLYVFNIKQIDDVKLTADYIEEEFNNLSKIYSYLEGYTQNEAGESTFDATATSYANYEMPYSQAYISIDPSTITNQETKKGVNISITTNSNSYIKKKWLNGEFLIKYPEEIIDMNINSVTVSDSTVKITGVDTYEENGNLYTKIYTSNDVEKNFQITINADITADPRKPTSTEKIEMYYYNPACHNYYSSARKTDEYDMNGNENTEENVGYTTTTLNLVAPSNLLTSQIGTEFDDIGSVVVAPQEATVNKIDGTKTAKVNINLTNNYSNTISEVKIVGKIPFEGNTYQLNKGDLGSAFDTTMTSEGIVVPEELKEYTTVYYSYSEEVTDDINAKKNGWTTTPEDMSRVKSYLIDLGDYVMPVDNTKTFNYTIQIPSGLDYNEVSYSAHAVYYCLDTDQGKLKTQTEPNKLGFRIAEKYDLEITKYETNSTKVVPGVVFSAQEIGAEETKTATTYSSGIATIKNLYVEKEYIIKEIKTNHNYILDTIETKIIGHIVDGELQIEILEGGFKTTPTIEVIENANTKVKASLENEVKYNFVLNKTQTGTNDVIQGIRFELTDNSGSVKKYTTNGNGQLTIKLLEPNVQYTLTETESQGHYLKDAVTFMMIRDENNNLKFNVLAGDLDTLPVIDQTGEVPVVTAGLENEKIPTYTLRITKKEADTETTIAGAQFKLIGENKADNVLYTTDGNGVIQIDNLYQYVEGKDITGEYSLQEIYPTEGYVLNDEPVVFKATKDATDNLTLEITSGTIREAIEDVVVDNTNPDNPIINITIDNDPVFTLTKVDAETGEPLEGVGFEITDLDGNYVTDANGNLIGINEIEELSLSSTGKYLWTQNEDGIWQSGNYNISSSDSILTSERFTITENTILSFDWSVSSQNYYDYLYYRVINTVTDEIIGGTNTKISGTSYGTEYESLIFKNKQIELEPGTYNIEFVYYKNSYSNSGTDRGYVKNLKLISADKTVKTDKNGKIRLSLKEGLYKATETKPLEGYQTPELYTGIGIGESKSATIDGLDLEWEKGDIYARFSDIAAVEDGYIAVGNNWVSGSVIYSGNIVKFDFNGNIEWQILEVESYNEPNAITIVDDGFIVASLSGEVAKYDFGGKFQWRNIEKSHTKITFDYYNYNDIITVEDGVIAITNEGQVVKYDFEGNLVWENIEKTYSYRGIVAVQDGAIVVSSDGEVVKYDLNGNIVWQNTEKALEYNDVVVVEDGIIAIANDFESHRYDGCIVKYDFSGNFKWQSSKKEYMHYEDAIVVNDGIIVTNGNSSVYEYSATGTILKYDFEGNIVWENTEKRYRCSSIAYNETQIAVVGYDGEFVRYDLNGNLISENTRKTWNLKDVVTVDNSIIAIAESGNVARYDFDGNKEWENTEKLWIYNDITVVEDGVIVSGYGYPEIKNEGIQSVGCIVKYDLNGNIVWETTEKSYKYYYTAITSVENGVIATSTQGKVVKYDLNGNKEWENSEKTYNYQAITTVEDGVIAVGDSGEFVKYDLNGNVIYDQNKGDFDFQDIVVIQDWVITVDKDGYIKKYDFDGNLVWSKRIDSFDDFYDITILNDTIVIVGSIYNTTSARGRLEQFDLDGNVLSSKIGMENYIGVTTIENGVIVVSIRGTIEKYINHISEPEIIDSRNLIIENKISKYKITTKVEGHGGSISGMNENVYEEVRYLENSTKDIIIKPSIGYKVKNISINGEYIDFSENDDKTVELNKFTAMKEDKEVIVSFVKESNSLIIKKINSILGTPLVNARFNIKQIEERTEPITEEIVGSIVANGNIYYQTNTESEIQNVLGDMVNNNENYYFIDNGNGGYESNNQGISSSTANSYIKIDLTEQVGKVAIVVNASISSELSYDYGYAIVTNSTGEPNRYSSGRLIYISGTQEDKSYTTMVDGGQEYYLHLRYYKNSSTDSGDDKFTVNSIKIYNTISNTYNFVENGNGGYESNNQGQASTTANSYIPIDLTGYKGKYNLIVNANVSSQSGNDYGYATITTSTDAPTYSTSTGRFIYIAGTSSGYTTPKDYTTVLEGGKQYYLHLGYRKNDSTDSGDDKFTVNSINLTLNQSDFLKDTEIVTNLDGEAVIQIDKDWRYEITEIEAPEGYTLNSTPIIYDFVTGQENIITVKNDPQVDIIVHHYIKDTTTSVAPDETQKGDLGKEYSTFPKTDLVTYQLVKNADGSYQIPDNASGIYTEETQVVTYYYEVAPVQLIVHHYLDGTEDCVAPDEISEGQQGAAYTTSPVVYPTLEEKYELVTTKLPENGSGTLDESITEVTYYYKIKEYNITTEVDGENGTISGEGVTPYEIVLQEESSVKDIIITPNEGYQIKNITINGVEQNLPEDKKSPYVLDKFTNMTEDKHIIVSFESEIIDYIVTKVWEDNSNELGKRPENVEIQLYNGNELVETQSISEENPKIIHQTDIKFSQMSDTYPWTQNEDGTWQSGNYNVNSTTSVLTSDVFEVKENTVLNFEWSVSSQGKSYDYLYYIIKNADTNATVTGGTSTKIGGTSYGTVYSNLTYSDININLNSGKYIIEFIYRKSASTHSGLDRGFVKNITLNGDIIIKNQWEAKFNVPLLDSSGNKINYSVVEKEVNTDDLYMYDSSITYGENEATITNTFSIPDTKVDIAATKTWVDNDNINLKRPSQIKLQLKNGDTVLQEQVLDVTTENTQSYTFTDLPEYDENGNTIEYTIDEVEVNTDDLKFYTKTVNNETYTITNTFTVPEDKVNVDVTKKWEDNSNANNVRPTQITLQVKNGDEVVQEKTVDVTSDNEKVYTFENLAKYDANGQEIVYTADEKEVEGYTKTTDGTTVTNTIKSYKVTTEVKDEGGTISGQDEEPYEEVPHGGTSVKDITITPDEGYEISKITINDAEQLLPDDPTVPYTMDKFENVTEDKHVIVEFKKREYEITTEVDGEGGAITGEGETTYETVIHGENSVKDIIITPDAGYKITSITVNGQAIEFTPDSEDNYTLDKFVNMTEDKHIVVKFEKKDTSIIVKHQTEDGTDLVDPETVNGKVGDTYTTTEKDFEDYEIKTIPDNANGTMTEEQIEVIYVYSLVKGKITVTKVDINDTNTKLSGATFKLEKLDDNGNIDTTFTSQEKTTESAGTVEFVDLLVGKYQITETIAPEGYELNTEVTEVEVTKENRELNVTVKNREKLVLPETGEINYTVIISAVGIVVMSIALIILKNTRNKKENI